MASLGAGIPAPLAWYHTIVICKGNHINPPLPQEVPHKNTTYWKMVSYPLIKEGLRSHKYAFLRASGAMLLHLGASLKRVNGAIILENGLVPPCSILLLHIHHVNLEEIYVQNRSEQYTCLDDYCRIVPLHQSQRLGSYAGLYIHQLNLEEIYSCRSVYSSAKSGGGIFSKQVRAIRMSG